MWVSESLTGFTHLLIWHNPKYSGACCGGLGVRFHVSTPTRYFVKVIHAINVFSPLEATIVACKKLLAVVVQAFTLLI